MANIAVIGAGFSGMSAAAYLSAAGHSVHVYEKNATAGGRARQFRTENGYVFDMGPSWYWMPDIFENFFDDFGFTVSGFYELKRLDPAFEMVFSSHDIMSIPAGYDDICDLFDSVEGGAGSALRTFMNNAEKKYMLGLGQMANKPGLSVTEFIDANLLKNVLNLTIFSSLSKHVRRYFSNSKIIALMEFPVLFLGAMPQQTPALYSLMNYAELKLGTWYPVGGFGNVVEAVKKTATTNGVKFHFNSPVERITAKNNETNGVVVGGEEITCDAIVATADYHHTENLLLPDYRNYSEEYWNLRTLAPSCLIYYVGLGKRILHLKHHTLFFEEDFLQHSKQIYKNPQWPEKPLFYVCCPTKTDEDLAPDGHETLFMLMPIAPDLKDNSRIREKYFKLMMTRLEKQVGEPVEPYINFKKSYCINDFKSDYNAYKGNGYGLANTLKQTHVLKPKIKNKKLDNLVYAGQFTVPGPGVPPALISGKIAARQLIKYLNESSYEVAF